jgi:hypothetical protein
MNPETKSDAVKSGAKRASIFNDRSPKKPH